jgi:hypothetical protein
MSTFKDQLYHLGGIPVGSGFLPATGIASDGVSSARAFFVHGYLGVDGNSGSSPKTALKTLTAAYDLCEDGRGDTVYILNDGSTTATVRDVALTWAKDNTHIVGLCAPTLVNQRARISPATTVTTVTTHTPYLTLSASGCIISNVSWYQGQSQDSQASVGILCSGSRNYFNNVGIITGAHANQGDEVTYNLNLTGSENTFENCYIGQDTAARSNFASANVCFGAGSLAAPSEAARNVFRDCIFPMWADGAAPVFVKVAVLTDIARWNLFQRCNFFNTGTSTITEAVSVPGSSTGKLFFDNCGFYGCTDVTAADSSLVQMLGPTPGTPVECGLYKGVDIAG